MANSAKLPKFLFKLISVVSMYQISGYCFLCTLIGYSDLGSAIHLLGFFWILCANFPSFLRKKELFGAVFLQVWYILKQLFTSVSVKSGGYLLSHEAAR